MVISTRLARWVIHALKGMRSNVENTRIKEFSKRTHLRSAMGPVLFNIITNNLATEIRKGLTKSRT